MDLNELVAKWHAHFTDRVDARIDAMLATKWSIGAIDAAFTAEFDGTPPEEPKATKAKPRKRTHTVSADTGETKAGDSVLVVDDDDESHVATIESVDHENGTIEVRIGEGELDSTIVGACAAPRAISEIERMVPSLSRSQLQRAIKRLGAAGKLLKLGGGRGVKYQAA